MGVSTDPVVICHSAIDVVARIIKQHDAVRGGSLRGTFPVDFQGISKISNRL
jgi:hypothetical protein